MRYPTNRNDFEPKAAVMMMSIGFRPAVLALVVTVVSGCSAHADDVPAPVTFKWKGGQRDGVRGAEVPPALLNRMQKWWPGTPSASVHCVPGTEIRLLRANRLYYPLNPASVRRSSHVLLSNGSRSYLIYPSLVDALKKDGSPIPAATPVIDELNRLAASACK